MIPETPLRPLHEVAGAQLAEYFGCLMPERFTDPREEYRFARETVGVVDKNYRAWFDLTGPDRVRYLNAVTSNNIRDLQTGQGIAALLLNAQGHILAELEVYALPDRLRIATHAMNRARALDTLDKYIIMDDATIEDVTDRFGAIALEGPQTPPLLASFGAPSLGALSELGHVDATIAGVACMMVRRSPGGIPGAEFIASRGDLPRLWTALLDAAKSHGGGAVGYSVLSTLRLEAGIPWFGYDFDDTMIPQEAALEQTHVSFTKGCYTGQEIVERVRSRGHVNRRRAGVAFTGSEIPEAKTILFADGAEVGRVTRAAFSYALNRPIGFAYLRRDFAEKGMKLTWAGGEAEVIELPLRAEAKSPAPSR
jgi:folate-binding protein YgfZ